MILHNTLLNGNTSTTTWSWGSAGLPPGRPPGRWIWIQFRPPERPPVKWIWIHLRVPRGPEPGVSRETPGELDMDTVPAPRETPPRGSGDGYRSGPRGSRNRGSSGRPRGYGYIYLPGGLPGGSLADHPGGGYISVVDTFTKTALAVVEHPAECPIYIAGPRRLAWARLLLLIGTLTVRGQVASLQPII